LRLHLYGPVRHGEFARLPRQQERGRIRWYLNVYVCKCLCLCLCACASRRVCKACFTIRVWSQALIDVCMFMCVCAYTHTHTPQTRTHTHKIIRIYTHSITGQLVTGIPLIPPLPVNTHTHAAGVTALDAAHHDGWPQLGYTMVGHTHTHTCTHTLTDTYTRAHAPAYTPIHTNTHARARAHTHTCTRAHTHTQLA